MEREEIQILISKGEKILSYRPKCFDYGNMFVPTEDSYCANNGKTIYDGFSSRFFFERAKEWIEDCCAFFEKEWYNE